MAYDKQDQPVFKARMGYDLDVPEDKKIIREFEMEVQPYFQKEIEIYGKRLTGFDLFLHEKGMFRFTEKYPYGAVNPNRLNEFRETNMKIYALRELCDRRNFCKKKGGRASS